MSNVVATAVVGRAVACGLRTPVLALLICFFVTSSALTRVLRAWRSVATLAAADTSARVDPGVDGGVSWPGSFDGRRRAWP